jgi:hypothetical protein
MPKEEKRKINKDIIRNTRFPTPRRGGETGFLFTEMPGSFEPGILIYA